MKFVVHLVGGYVVWTLNLYGICSRSAPRIRGGGRGSARRESAWEQSGLLLLETELRAGSGRPMLTIGCRGTTAMDPPQAKLRIIRDRVSFSRYCWMNGLIDSWGVVPEVPICWLVEVGFCRLVLSIDYSTSIGLRGNGGSGKSFDSTRNTPYRVSNDI